MIKNHQFATAPFFNFNFIPYELKKPQKYGKILYCGYCRNS